MKRLITILAALILAAPALAQEKLSDAEIKVRVAKAKAKARDQVVAAAAATKAVPYDDAARLAKREGRPLFVSVGLDCRATCEALRPDFVTCHVAGALDGLARGARLEIPAPVPSGFIRLTWKDGHCPTAAEVRRVVAEQPKSQLSEAEAFDAAMLAVLALSGVEFDVCPGGVCPNVPTGYTLMPAAGGGQAVSPPDTTAAAAQFVARFPRLAHRRAAFRQRLGLPAPAAIGSFVAVQAVRGVESAAASATGAGKSGPEVSAEATAKLKPDLVARAERAGIPRGTIIRLIIKYGPIILEILQALLDDKIQRE